MPQSTMITVSTMAELKALTPTPGQTVFMLGAVSEGDGLAGTYRWAAGDSTTEDTTYGNAVASTVAGMSGRWLRNLVRAQALPHGVLVASGGVKTFHCGGTTDLNSEIRTYLTMDGTANGTAIFADVWTAYGEATANAPTPGTVVTVYRKSLSADRKLLVHGASKPVLSIVIAGPAGPGVTARIRVEGT